MSRTSVVDRHLVLPLDPAMQNETPTLDNGKMFPWGPQHAFHVKDAGEAEALKQKYGHRLDYARMKSPDVHDRGHKYVFQVPTLPWKENHAAQEG